MTLKFILTALASLLVLAIFIGLGTWQLQRLGEKEAIIAAIRAEISAPPVTLPDAPREDTHKYLPIKVTGHFTGPELHLLASDRDYGAGFRVIQAFETAPNRRILVDRGFIRQTEKNTARTTAPVEVIGNLHWPQDRTKYTPENDPDANYWYARDMIEMAETLNTEPTLIVAKSRTHPQISPNPVTTDGIPNRHLEYVGTWFLLAATWSVMTGFALWRMKRRHA